VSSQWHSVKEKLHGEPQREIAREPQNVQISLRQFMIYISLKEKKATMTLRHEENPQRNCTLMTQILQISADDGKMTELTGVRFLR